MPAHVLHGGLQQLRDSVGRVGIPVRALSRDVLFPTMLFLAATPIVRGVRAGESVMAHPIALLLRLAFLTLVAAGWLFMLWDQMPWFLGGVPGCESPSGRSTDGWPILGIASPNGERTARMPRL